VRRVRVVGIDPSLTASAFVTLVDSRLESAVKRAAPRDWRKGPNRFRGYDALLRGIRWRDAALIVVEGYSMRSSGNALTRLAELGAWMRQRWWRAGVPFTEVAPVTLKAWVTDGLSQADKMRVREHAAARWSGVDDSWDDNLVDAYSLARMGTAILKGSKDRRLGRLQVVRREGT